MTAIEATVDQLIVREGGYVYTDRKHDRGGKTFAGLTFTAYNRIGRATGEWPGVKSDRFQSMAREAEKNPKHVLRSRVRFAFKHEYLDRFKDLPKGLREMTQDAAINCGWNRAAKWIQKAVGARPDGIVGPDTLRDARAAASKAGDRRAAMMAFTALRLEHCGRLVQKAPAQAENIVGWQRRCMNVLAEAMEMY